MVLEPISAFSVACNVLQVVETAIKVLDKAAEYRSSSGGALSEEGDLRQTYSTLERLNNDLTASLQSAGSDQAHSAAEERLIECNAECLRLSQDFVKLLDHLNARKLGTVLESIRRAIKALRYKDKIEAMEKNVSRARENLTLSFIIYMESKQHANATQTDVLESGSHIQPHLAGVVSNSTSSIHSEVRDLSMRLESLNLDSIPTLLSDFIEAHRPTLADVSAQVRAICDLQTRERDDQAKQNLLQSLYYGQMYEWKDRIKPTYHNTYHWVLSSQTTHKMWDSLVAWLDDPQPRSNIYWITSKPGAGKSSLIRFLAHGLDATKHMLNWVRASKLVKLEHYLWISGGVVLQKNLAGVLRSLLHQLFKMDANLLTRCTPRDKWRFARTSNSTLIEWTIPELLECLDASLSSVTTSAKCLILIDGLDEIDGEDDSREELVQVVTGLGRLQHVKLCVSSRDWTIFRDAFGGCPGMRLQDLNYNDIEIFVQGQFDAQSRYQQMLRYDNATAVDFVGEVVKKSEGVFLWARLVVTELVRGLRHGDSSLTLQRKLRDIPAGLNEYFCRILDSIEPDHRQEASFLFQIALYRDTQFVNLQPLRLIDLVFIDQASSDFALRPDLKTYLQRFTAVEPLIFQLECALRKLSSRCKGLLECYRGFSNFYLDAHSNGGEGTHHTTPPAHTALSSTSLSWIRQDIYGAFDLHVGFMHRSIKDYLHGTEAQQFLGGHLPARLDVRNYLRNARLVEMFLPTQVHQTIILGLANYVLCTLSVPDFRETSACFDFAARLRVAYGRLLRYEDVPKHDDHFYTYLACCLRESYTERGSFLSLAIDFALTGFLNKTLTTEAIQEKSGRPLLDYALRPRFSIHVCYPSKPATIGNQDPLPDLVQALLCLGADPNQLYAGVSIWALFLSAVVIDSVIFQFINQERTNSILSLEAMLSHGAALLVAKSALSVQSGFGVVRTSDSYDTLVPAFISEDSFIKRWPVLSQELEIEGMNGPEYSIIHIFECMRPRLGNAVDNLKAVARPRGSAF